MYVCTDSTEVLQTVVLLGSASPSTVLPQLHDAVAGDCASLDETDVVVEVADDDLASALVWVVLLVGRAVLVALHGVCFATSCLPIREDGCVETVDNYLDEAWHLKALKCYACQRNVRGRSGGPA